MWQSSGFLTLTPCPYEEVSVGDLWILNLFKFPHVAKSTLWLSFQFYLCDELSPRLPPTTLTLTVHKADVEAENLISQGWNLLHYEYTCQWQKVTGRNSNAYDAHCYLNNLGLHC